MGFQFFSGIAVTAVTIVIFLVFFIGFIFDLKTIVTSTLFIVIAIASGWVAQIAFAIGLIFVYSFWRSFGILLSVFSSALVSIFVINALADVPSSFDITYVDRAISFLCSNLLVFLATIIAFRALHGHSRFDWFREKAIFFAAFWGVSFYRANLAEISFDDLDLSHTDFRESKLLHTSFRGAKNLRFARLSGTILAQPKVQKLLTLPLGVEILDKDFSYLDLSGASLKNINLEGAVFVGANLTNVDFSGANLSGANFTKAQLFDTNFSRAILDEICIQDWSINHRTCFQSVQCSWVYLQQGKYGFLEKKPDIGEFQPSEFEKWIRQLQDTIDLILREQPNVPAMVKAIERVAHNSNGLDPSRFSIESKGENLYVARIGTTPGADKAELASTIVINYNSINEIMIQGESNRLLLNPEGGYMENQNQNIHAGGNFDMSSGARVNVGRDVVGSSITLGDLNGQVSNAINSLSDIETSDEQNIAKVFAALQSTINGDQALSQANKTEAMEAVSTLAEEAQKPKEQRITKLCSMAVNALKGINSTVTDVSKLADILETHLPTIIKFFGL